MAKNNQKSIRFSDEVAEIVESMKGNGFNEKFENLCLDYKHTIPKRKKELYRVEQLVVQYRNELDSLRQQIEQLKEVSFLVTELVDTKDRLNSFLNKCNSKIHAAS